MRDIQKGEEKKETMNRSAVLASLVLATLLALGVVGPAAACNDAVCGSIVSKCTLLQSCNCTIEEGRECTCCKRCQSCLEPLYTECCSCFEGFCPQRNVTQAAQDSTVFDLDDRVPELWDALLEGEDERWNKVVFPVELHPSMVVNQNLNRGQQQQEVSQEGEQDTVLTTMSDLVTVNCTVAFHEQCMSKDKCMQNCRTMGATSGRWFGESGGCCECIGHNCRNYGLKEPRCLGCIEDEDGEELEDQMSVSELEQMSDAELEQYYNSYLDDAESRGEDEL